MFSMGVQKLIIVCGVFAVCLCPVQGCESGWSSFLGSCYKVILENKTSYEAQTYCEGQGGYLASLDLPEESDFVRDLINEKSSFDAVHFIGLSDAETEKKFKWTSGQTLAYDNHWKAGEPNDYGTGEDCSMFYQDEWYDFGCSRIGYFVCEIPGCPSGWSAYHRSCYKLITEKKTWNDSRAFCQGYGGDLAALEEVPEADFVKNLTARESTLITAYWIGLTDEETEGTFKWTSGQTLAYSSYWNSNEPNNQGGAENCASFCCEGKWNDGSCSFALNFICEVPECGPLTNPANGFVTFTSTSSKGTATYSCDTGYEGNGGSSTRTCGSDGYWSGSELVCTLKDCLSLSNPDGGTVTYTNSTYQQTATYTCNTGYNVTGGSATRACAANGNWSGIELECTIKDCLGLSDPANGVVTVTNTTYQENATYMCNTGYEGNSENATRTCGADGSWSGSELVCTIKDCGALSDPAGGSVTSPATTYLSTAVYQCNEGYSLTTGDKNRTCQEDGKWDGKEIICRLIVCYPNNTIEIYGLPEDYHYFAMQNVTGGTDVKCDLTDINATAVCITGCDKDLPILLTFGTYTGMEANALHGGKTVVAIVITCDEIQAEGVQHLVDNTFGVNLTIDEQSDINPSYDITSNLDTTSTTVGSQVVWTINFPIEYILEVTSCQAYPGTSESNSSSVSLVSKGGCYENDELISHFTDNMDGTATATILAFKFFTNDNVYLKCDLKICPKGSTSCDTSCSRKKRMAEVFRVARATDANTRLATVHNVLRVVDPFTSSGNPVPTYSIAMLLTLTFISWYLSNGQNRK